jgi:glycosyltransferase involved in cell wall biosynthesis
MTSRRRATGGAGCRRVVHITTVHPPKDVRIFWKECRSLAESGFAVTLLAPDAPRGCTEGVDLVPLPKHARRLTRFVKGSIDALRAVRRLPVADVYHFHDPELIFVGLALRAMGRAVIYDAHESVAKDIGTKAYLHPKVARTLGAVYRLVERTAGRTFDAIVCASSGIQRAIDLPNTIVVENYPRLEEFADFEFSLDDYAAREERAVYVGVLDDERCVPTLVRAAAIVAERRAGFTMVLAGPYEGDVAQLQGPGVRYEGVVDRARLGVLLHEARVGVYLVKDLPKFRDVVTTKNFEYMMAALPVVGSTTPPENAEIVRQTRSGVLVDAEQPEAVASAIEAFLESPRHAYQTGRSGREAAQARYSWASEASKLVATYESITTRRPSRACQIRAGTAGA